MKIKKRISNVKNFAINKSKFIYSINDDLYNSDNRLIIKDIDGARLFKIDDNYLQIWDKEKGCYYFNGSIFKSDFFIKNDSKSDFYLGHSSRTRISRGVYFSNIAIIDKNLEVKSIVLERTFGVLEAFNSNHFFIKENNCIRTYSLPTATPLWQYDLAELGTYRNREQEEKQYEVDEFLGVWNNSLLMSCYERLIIEIDIHSGKLLRKWQTLEGFGDSAYQGIFLNKIPPSYGFQLDISKSILFNLSGNHYVYIDLVSGKIAFQNISNNLKINNLKRFRYSSGYAEDADYIYTIGEMDEKHFGTDYIPQCILAFNKHTLKIDWYYRFENDGINTDIPQLSGDKLYQLSSNKVLYIFQKEQ